MAEATKEKEAVVQASSSEETEKNENIVVEPKNVEAGDVRIHTAGAIGDLMVLPGLRTDLPETRTGDVIRVFYRVIEGGKERIQVFEGTVIAIKNRGVAKTVTVRKTSFGIAVERIFPLNSKLIQKVEVKKHQRVKRAKLYYLRNLRGKAARLQELR